MWIVAVYDCPMTSAKARKSYAQFRKELLSENFVQLQNSLYARHYSTMESASAVIERLTGAIPEAAAVSFFLLTDKQFGMTREFIGRQRQESSLRVPEQVELFL
jgi:CRISPR-associated protein Cas2